MKFIHNLSRRALAFTVARLLLIYYTARFMEKEFTMFVNHSKVLTDINSLRLVVNHLTRPSAVSAGPDGTCSPSRSRAEKLTGVLIILSILALILTF